MMATLLLATGTPMMLAGDEMGRTQLGNNNAYCQDSPLSWVDWHTTEEWGDQLELTRTLLALRAGHPILRPREFRTPNEVLDADGRGLGRHESAWFGESGLELGQSEWEDPGRRNLGMYVSDLTEAFYVFVHGGDWSLQLTLPAAPWATAYRLVAHTGTAEEFSGLDSPLSPGAVVEVPGRTVLVFQADVCSEYRAPEVVREEEPQPEDAAETRAAPWTGVAPEPEAAPTIRAPARPGRLIADQNAGGVPQIR
jgi:glycogen operon protein